MDLTTRCPQCGTTFSASLEQLQLRKGYIRCVQCAHIFDGYDAVVAPGADAGHRAGTAPKTSSVASGDASTFSSRPSETDGISRPGSSSSDAGGISSPSSGSPAPGDISPGKSASPAYQEPEVPHFLTSQKASVSAATSGKVMPQVGNVASVTPSVVRSRREFTISDQHAASPAEVEPSWSISGAVAHSAHAAADIRDAPVHVIAKPDDDHVKILSEHVETEPDHVKIDPEERGPKARYLDAGREPADTYGRSGPLRSLVSTVWMVMIVAGVLIFAAQLVYVFRVQLAESIPALRPGLERLCTALDCTVAYSRQLDMIVITQSSLQQDPAATGSDGNNAVLLQLTLRNVYDGPQEWPTLVLDLKDFSGALIARKHLPKDVYLPADRVELPFQAVSEHMVVLPLMMQDLKVNGYQLTAFFP